MGRIIFAEDSTFSYLKNISKLSSFSTGLILGQCGQTTDYVVHLVRSPEQVLDSPPSTGLINIQTVNDIKESAIIDHAKHVTRMLPGGFWVLGIFVCTSTDIFSDTAAQSRLKSIIYQLKKNLLSEPLLYANSPSPDKLLLHFNSEDHKYTCKTLDANVISSTFKPADWKFKNNFTKWYQISCRFDLDQPSLAGHSVTPLKSQLKHVLTEVNSKIESALVTFNGKVAPGNETLDSFADKLRNVKHRIIDKENEEVSSLEANIFIPFSDSASLQEEISIKNCDVELQLLGVLGSQVFLHQRATIFEAINAVKQDIVRSLAARLEMHWDSLVEEECGSPEEKQTIHEPPRRVIVQLPNGRISFSDYLFPGEGASEVLSSFKELLDITISETNVQKDFEIQGDPTEFYTKSSISLTSSSNDDMLRPSLPTGFLVAAFSVAVILIGVAIALHLRRSDNSDGDQ